MCSEVFALQEPIFNYFYQHTLIDVYFEYMLPEFLYIFYISINFNAQIYIGHNCLYSMENKENNPTVVAPVTADSDTKKEDPKKEESAKKEK